MEDGDRRRGADEYQHQLPTDSEHTPGLGVATVLHFSLPTCPNAFRYLLAVRRRTHPRHGGSPPWGNIWPRPFTITAASTPRLPHN